MELNFLNFGKKSDSVLKGVTAITIDTRVNRTARK